MVAPQISHELSRPGSKNEAVSVKTIPNFVIYIAFLVTLGFVGLILSVIAGLHLGNALVHPNPFTAYQSLWPDQSMISVAEFVDQTPSIKMLCSSATSPLREYLGTLKSLADNFDRLPNQIIKCSSVLSDSVFSTVDLTVYQGRVQELDFSSYTLHEDTLFLYWGAPDVVTNAKDADSVHLIWNRGTYSAVATVLKHSFVVSSVEIAAIR